MIITEVMAEQKIHEGRNVRRLREILGIKQEALAVSLDLSQQAVSQLEQRERIEPELLERVAGKLGVTTEAIKNFNEQATINNISCNFHDFHDNASVFQFNPVDKIVELYDALLKEKDEKIEMLKKLMDRDKSSQ